jgi:hypothetical protein
MKGRPNRRTCKAEKMRWRAILRDVRAGRLNFTAETSCVSGPVCFGVDLASEPDRTATWVRDTCRECRRSFGYPDDGGVHLHLCQTCMEVIAEWCGVDPAGSWPQERIGLVDGPHGPEFRGTFGPACPVLFLGKQSMEMHEVTGELFAREDFVVEVQPRHRSESEALQEAEQSGAFVEVLFHLPRRPGKSTFTAMAYATRLGAGPDTIVQPVRTLDEIPPIED